MDEAWKTSDEIVELVKKHKKNPNTSLKNQILTKVEEMKRIENEIKQKYPNAKKLDSTLMDIQSTLLIVTFMVK